MKKRIKLSLSIICICISFLTLSYGVFAATNHTLSVTNYIEFETTGIYVKVNSLKIYKNSTYNKGTTPIISFTTPANIRPDSDIQWTSQTKVELDSINRYLVYEFSITNESQEYVATADLKEILLPKDKDGQDNLQLVDNSGNNKSTIKFDIAKGATNTIIFAFKVIHLETAIPENTVSFKMNFENPKKPAQ